MKKVDMKLVEYHGKVEISSVSINKYLDCRYCMFDGTASDELIAHKEQYAHHVTVVHDGTKRTCYLHTDCLEKVNRMGKYVPIPQVA